MCVFSNRSRNDLLHELTWNLQAIAGWLCWLKRHLETGCSPRLKALFMNEEFALTLFPAWEELCMSFRFWHGFACCQISIPIFHTGMRMLQNRCLCWNLQRSAVFFTHGPVLSFIMAMSGQIIFFAGPLRTKYEIEAAPAPVEMTIFHQNFKILILSHIFPAWYCWWTLKIPLISHWHPKKNLWIFQSPCNI